jgi:hypothetical protein
MCGHKLGGEAVEQVVEEEVLERRIRRGLCTFGLDWDILGTG